MPYTLLRGEFVIRYPDLPRQGRSRTATRSSSGPMRPAWSRRCAALRAPRPTSTPGASRCGWRRSARWRSTSAGPTRSWPAATRPRRAARPARVHTGVRFFDDLPGKVASADQGAVQGRVLAAGIEGNGRLVAFACRRPSRSRRGLRVRRRGVGRPFGQRPAAGRRTPTPASTPPCPPRCAATWPWPRPRPGRGRPVAYRRPRRPRHHRRPGGRPAAGDLAQAVPAHRPLPGRRVRRLRRLRRLAGPTRSTRTTRCSWSTRWSPGTSTTSCTPPATRSASRGGPRSS